MPSVAEHLRAGREGRKWTIHQVADATMIKTEHIRSLENGDYSPFSAPVYIRGHVKALARALQLDPAAILVQLDQELSQTEEFSAPPSLSPRRKGALDWVMLQISKMHLQVLAPFIILVALLGSIVWGYTLWRQNQATDPLKDLGQGIYQGQLQVGGQYLPLPAGATNPPSSTR
jgi:cytoskeletal protein RodZ